MTNFNEVKIQSLYLLETKAKPSELYSFFRSFDAAKAQYCDVMEFNKLCGFTSEYKDAMNNGNDDPEWLS